MSGLALRSKQFKVSCKKCGEESVVTIHTEGLHAFICPYCGQPHLLLVDPNLGLRDFRQISSVPTQRPFDIARIKIKDETLIPTQLKPFVESLKRGILPPNADEVLKVLEELDLIEVEEGG
ncbi:MAG: hypothetical protein QW096_04535 [Thermofilaceae archaeon]